MPVSARICPECGEINRSWREHCSACQTILIDVPVTYMDLPDARETKGIPEKRTDTRIVDLRPADARQRENRAQRSLDIDDEKIAQELARLSTELSELEPNILTYEGGKAKELGDEISKIGKFLCSNGGPDRMDLICYRVYFLCGTSRHVRRNWDGICGWMY